METNSMIFSVFVESGKQRLDCACAVGLGFGPLVFTLWASLGALGIFNVFLTSFDVPLGPYFSSSEKVGGRAGTQLIDTRRELLLLVPRSPASAPLRGFLRAAWWARPSSPRPDLRRLRRAPGRGRFVYVFWVFVALCKALWCLFSTLGGLLVPLWHLGLPF